MKYLPSLLVVAYSSQIASALSVQVGYFAGLAGGLPGTEPNVGCGLWAQAEDGGDTSTATFSGGQPTDSCPGADVDLFCSRWGCPFTMTFDSVVAFTVESDNHDDKSISVKAVGSAGSGSAICPWEEKTVVSNGDGTIYQSWSCNIDGL